MEAHDRDIRHIGERVADTGNPGAIDEPEIGERVSSQLFEQFGRRTGQRRRIRAELASDRWCQENNADGREHKSASEPTGVLSVRHLGRLLPLLAYRAPI